MPEPTGTATAPGARSRLRRRLVAQAATVLLFDGVILVAMLALAWELFVPWSRVLDAADGLLGIGLLVCGGVWLAFVKKDVLRWRRLRRNRRAVRR